MSIYKFMLFLKDKITSWINIEDNEFTPPNPDDLKDLYCNNDAIILDVLFKFGGGHFLFEMKDKEKIISFLDSHDEDIRERAAFVSGIHYRWPEAFKPIVRRIFIEEDECTLSAFVLGIGSIGQDNNIIKDQCADILAKISLDSSFDKVARGNAYNNLLALFEKVTPQEYGAAIKNIENIKMNKPWLSSLLIKKNGDKGEK